MPDLLLRLYFLNAILLIVHEIDSAYWKEWELFRLPGGLPAFLLLHFPILFFILYGLVLLSKNDPNSLIFSLVLSLGGIVAFGIHMYFISKGRSEFRKTMSLAILIATLLVSVIQLFATIKLLG